jgi:hypothetical protein
VNAESAGPHGSRRQALTPFGTTPPDNDASGAGPHARPKAVYAGPLALLGLIGSLHSRSEGESPILGHRGGPTPRSNCLEYPAGPVVAPVLVFLANCGQAPSRPLAAAPLVGRGRI